MPTGAIVHQPIKQRQPESEDRKRPSLMNIADQPADPNDELENIPVTNDVYICHDPHTDRDHKLALRLQTDLLERKFKVVMPARSGGAFCLVSLAQLVNTKNLLCSV